MSDSHDYGFAYEEEIRSVTEMLRKLRSEGSRKLQYIPGLQITCPIWQLDDDEIRSCAIYEAEKYTNHAMKIVRG